MDERLSECEHGFNQPILVDDEDFIDAIYVDFIQHGGRLCDRCYIYIRETEVLHVENLIVLVHVWRKFSNRRLDLQPRVSVEALV